ncbi:hypothetical protein BN1012_Phect509 [Candidatus Phaeomarinobacter ectocarpi]|uniref:Uncharacterized protein n=1 Tax=Candidatus Phaeomarinibacter ectocarpi TaxID=1458461 RepID=X5M6Q3_9HYPH|nr:hypothetical protein BN1012_Phect509 [Candidatus Phaeomarinobacter ectocarpi]
MPPRQVNCVAFDALRPAIAKDCRVKRLISRCQRAKPSA